MAIDFVRNPFVDVLKRGGKVVVDIVNRLDDIRANSFEEVHEVGVDFVVRQLRLKQRLNELHS